MREIALVLAIGICIALNLSVLGILYLARRASPVVVADPGSPSHFALPSSLRDDLEDTKEIPPP